MKTGMKIAIIGAGSSYTPEIVEKLVELKDELPVEELAFMDIDPVRMEIVADFCRRFMKHLGYEIPLYTTTDRRKAIDGARFVITQIRVGLNAQRILDEKIPLKYGMIGQETTGPGGMFKALRTIPAMLEIAGDVQAVAPEAWIINYTNPTGLVAEAVTRYSQAKIAGLCSGVFSPRQAVCDALNVPPEAVDYDYFGLNHLNFAYNLRLHGRPLSEAEFELVLEEAAGDTVDVGLLRALRLVPSSYLQYYFQRSRKVQTALAKPTTRGEDVLELEKEIFAAYADPSQVVKPAALARRGGGGYSEIALGVIQAIYADQDRIFIVNVPNRGAARGLPDEAVLEIPCLVNAGGIFPLAILQTTEGGQLPQAVWGLIAAVKNYEQLVVEAAVSGSRQKALLALMAHPLVSDYDLAAPMLEEMLAANRAYLPQFFP
jgi:6-phospho-beta-glucosidase